MAGKGKVQIEVNADDNASKTFDTIGKKAEAMGKKYANAGKVMVGAGVAIIAGLGVAAKAAEAERINIARLSATLDNVGVSYDGVSESLEANLLALQRKTGIGDTAQRDALAELVLATGDYKKSLDLLPLALDFAAAKQMDVSMAAELLGRVAQGNTSVLTRYGITLKEGATAAEALAAIQDKVTGSAEKMASPLDILNASFGDMQESIGAALLPIFSEVIKKVTSITDSIGAWATKNPELIKTLLGIGIVLVGAGGLLLALTQISKAIIAVNAAMVVLHALSGPGGWIKLAAGIAIAAGAIAGVNALMNQGTTPTLTPVQTMPSFAAGGTVPGPIGQPVPVIAHGGEQFAGVGKSFGNNVTVNVYGSVTSENDLVQTIRAGLLKVQGNNSSLGFV